MKRRSRYLRGWFEDMKFKLVESIDNRLIEKSDPRSEISRIAADLADADNDDLHGYKSQFTPHQWEVIEAYCIENNIDFNDVKNNWDTHHINGIHPASRKHPDGKFHNVALVNLNCKIEEKNIHKFFTDLYKQHYIELLKEAVMSDDLDLNVILLRGVARCIAKHKDPEDYIVMKSDIKSIISKTIQKNIDAFNAIYSKYPKDIIYLGDLDFSKKKKS